jgi:hypothetical protein
MNGQTNTNPFSAWQNMMNEWSKTMSGQAAAGNPMDAWRDALNRWSSMTSGRFGQTNETANAWQQWTQKWMESAAAAAGGGGNPFAAWQEVMKAWSPQAAASPASAFDAWLSTYQKWVEQSAQFMSMSKPGVEFGFLNPFQAFNPFQTFTPYQLWQQLLQEYLNTWTDFASKNEGKAPSPDLFREAERSWLSKLDTIGQELAGSMSTEEFARTLGTTLEQSLVMEQKFAKATEDQVNAFLRAFHIPSRSQVERLFQRVIAIEERLDDADDASREVLKQLRELIARLEDLSEKAESKEPAAASA